jgi:hypothetical protein
MAALAHYVDECKVYHGLIVRHWMTLILCNTSLPLSDHREEIRARLRASGSDIPD